MHPGENANVNAESGPSDELMEKRYKSIMHLLSRSKIYSKILFEKLENQKREKALKKKHMRSSKRAKKKEAYNMLISQAIAERNTNIESHASHIDSQQPIKLDEPAGSAASPGCSRSLERCSSKFFVGKLRPYQMEGLQWLKVLYDNGLNGILADEMGLGKTIQLISFICRLISVRVEGPFLVIAPLSTLPHWAAEFERFAPEVPVLMFHGNAEKRRSLKQKLLKMSTVGQFSVYPVVLMSYQMPLYEKSFLGSQNWSYMVIDEGHRMKNINSQLTRQVIAYNCRNRLLLTGTPLQNNIAELWALLYFLMPDIFDNMELFESWVNVTELEGVDGRLKMVKQEQKTQILTTIHQILEPFMLRRVKADVALSIPPKKELVVHAPMTALQLKLYQATLDLNMKILLDPKNQADKEDLDGPRPKRKCSRMKNYCTAISSEDEDDDIFEASLWAEANEGEKVTVVDPEDRDYRICVKMQNPMMQMRKIVNHPYLIQFPLDPGCKKLRVDEDLVNKSGKLLVLDAMLVKLKAHGHKVLLFSTMVVMLDLLEEYVIMRNLSYLRLDGSHKLEDRNRNIQLFNSDPSIFLFLISTRAGGLGINLTGADTVIIYDSDWNPQVDLQAQDRCHRIGQEKPVMVYRLITKGTIDEKIVQRAGAKRTLEKIVLPKGMFKLDANQHSNTFHVKELRELLNVEDHCKTIQSNGYVFTDLELDELLDRSTLTSSIA